ncbi:hypothetical protein [Echinimonas agarilytica]|uniref:Uncharacterized protein n=1 Tax=Echinimonas agarilytica TaxID=1215918 RepID=A0AA41W6L1_9GAMM|nr:hypothetical protein [Echinimonas agarilytica]MCM2679637.1 hypothetical protein [Echinimonas agarilytica]
MTLLQRLIIFSLFFSVKSFAVNVVWENENIGSYWINEEGTYTIKGTVKGLIRIGSGVKGPVIIQGEGKNVSTLKDIDQDDGTIYVIHNGYGGKDVTVRNLRIEYGLAGHKGVNIMGNGNKLINVDVVSCSDRSNCAGHIRVGDDGVMDGVYANIVDDTFKVSDPGATVQNSTAVMKGNGSAITLDWGGANTPRHYAKNIIVKGRTDLHPSQSDQVLYTPDGRLYANHAAMSVQTKHNISEIHYTDIRVEDGPNFAFIARITNGGTGTIDNVWMTGELPDGATKKTKDGNTYSPIVINAGDGVIKNVTIDMRGKLSNPSMHYLAGELKNVWIDGVVYNGYYPGAYGNNVSHTINENARYVLLRNKHSGLNLKADDAAGALSMSSNTSGNSRWRMVPTSSGWFYLESKGKSNERLKNVDGAKSWDLTNNTGFAVQWRLVPSGEEGWYFLENRSHFENLKVIDSSPNLDLTNDTGDRVRWRVIATPAKSNL